MGEGNTGSEFLQQKYRLNADPVVSATAKQQERRFGVKIDQGDFSTRISYYLNRLTGIINPPQLEGHDHRFDRKARNLSMIKESLHRHYVTKPEDIPESYFESIKRRHKEEGHGDIEIPEDYRQELAQTVIEDQKGSLDVWVDYLASDDAKYPDFLKYFAFRSVLGMGNYDKNRGVFNERTRGGKTIAPFPELNREALAIVLGDLEKKYAGDELKPAGGRPGFEFTSRYDISEESKQRYLKALENKNFSQLYALAIEEFKPIAEGLLKNTAGKWIRYPAGSDPRQVVSSIANYGTGWCLRGEAMAERYLVRDRNDLYIYYSEDQAGNPIVPRVVMVINQSGNIAEVRGVATQENLDPYIGDVVDKKLDEPEFKKEGQVYKKRSSDMRILTAIDGKVKSGQVLTGEDLAFIYEIDAPIQGFGYRQDPRIAELRSQRNPTEDMPIVFGCSREQIATRVSGIRPDTKAYVGSLEKGIFDRLPSHIEHVYTSFPEGKIQRQTDRIGGKSAIQLKEELRRDDINISPYAEEMIDNPDFTTLKDPQDLDTVRLRVQDLGLQGASTIDQVYARAKELGLELCPPELGLRRRLKDTNQPIGEWYYIAMKPITDRRGDPHVFSLERGGDGMWLRGGWAGPDSGWSPEARFVFSLRKSEPQNLGFLGRFF